jgi:hypothetical protein
MTALRDQLHHLRIVLLKPPKRGVIVVVRDSLVQRINFALPVIKSHLVRDFSADRPSKQEANRVIPIAAAG